jgi:hypothetical protein
VLVAISAQLSHMTSLHASLGLRIKPLSFAEGMTGVFDHPTLSGLCHVSATPSLADARAIASDFIITGNDMRSALTEYGRTD